MSEQEKWFHRGNYIAGGLFIALGVFVGVYAATHYAYMDRYSLGPAFYPIWLGGFLAAVGALSLLQNKKGRFQERKKSVPSLEAWKNLGFFIGLVVLFLLIVNTLGMVLAMILFLIAVNLLISHNSALRSIVMAVVTSFSIYAVFHMAFHINFPKGFLGF